MVMAPMFFPGFKNKLELSEDLTIAPLRCFISTLSCKKSNKYLSQPASRKFLRKLVKEKNKNQDPYPQILQGITLNLHLPSSNSLVYIVAEKIYSNFQHSEQEKKLKWLSRDNLPSQLLALVTYRHVQN